jgi:prepilin-type N-terminal cleavage/methylation domain-containing protein
MNAFPENAAQSQMQPITRRSGAFTLVELLVVVAIIGILAGLFLTALLVMAHPYRSATGPEQLAFCRVNEL